MLRRGRMVCLLLLTGLLALSLVVGLRESRLAFFDITRECIFKGGEKPPALARQNGVSRARRDEPERARRSCIHQRGVQTCEVCDRLRQLGPRDSAVISQMPYPSLAVNQQV